MSRRCRATFLPVHVETHAQLLDRALERLDAERPAVHLALQLADQVGIAITALREIGDGHDGREMRRKAAQALEALGAGL